MDIQPSPIFPTYWQHDRQPVVLLGGTREDNVFQIPDLEEHLWELAANGGNYVRCTMSARDPGNVWPFRRDEATGLYDLNQISGGFWGRLEKLLELTDELGMIVQLELFDRFDFTRQPWLANPFNPRNNRNYSTKESGLKDNYEGHPSARENPFFRSVPGIENNNCLLPIQTAFVDRILKSSLLYGHVLYCVSNEANEDPAWSAYWAKHLKRAAEQVGKKIFVTEMWENRDILHHIYKETYEHQDTYGFVELSQVNRTSGRGHWEKLTAFRRNLAASGRKQPMNCVKVHGANTGFWGTTRDAQERFWQNLFAGVSAVRFHRPLTGLGLSEIAKANLRAARMFLDKFAIFSAHPDSVRVFGASPNEIYVTANPGFAYAAFFPDGGNALIETSDVPPNAKGILHWLDIRANTWHDPKKVQFNEHGQFHFVTPSEEGYWVAVLDVLDRMPEE